MVGEELLELVRTNPDLGPEEKEFSVHFSKVEEQADLYTEIASLTRRALAHTEIDVHEIKVRDEDGLVKTIAYSDDVGPADIDGIIVGARASFPIGLLKIQSNSRNQNNFAPVISPQTPPSEDAFD